MAAVLETVATVVAPFANNEHLFVKEFREAEALHLQSLDQSHRQFVAEQRLSAALHRRRQALSKELHYREMVHDIDVGKREAIRDVWSQHNQHVQTLMVIATVLFACVFSLAVEAIAPKTTPVLVLRLYTASTAVALGSLLVAIWVALKLQARMATYNMHRPSQMYVCGKKHPSFLDFFECHCAKLQRGAFACFYAGLVLTVVAGAFYLGAVLHENFYYPTTEEQVDLGTNATTTNHSTSASMQRTRQPAFAAPLWIFVALCAGAITVPVIVAPVLRRASGHNKQV